MQKLREYTEDKRDSWMLHSENAAVAAQKIAMRVGLDDEKVGDIFCLL